VKRTVIIIAGAILIATPVVILLSNISDNSDIIEEGVSIERLDDKQAYGDYMEVAGSSWNDDGKCAVVDLVLAPNDATVYGKNYIVTLIHENEEYKMDIWWSNDERAGMLTYQISYNTKAYSELSSGSEVESVFEVKFNRK